MKKVKVKLEFDEQTLREILESARKEGGYSGVTSRSKRIRRKVLKKRILHLVAQYVAEHQ